MALVLSRRCGQRFRIGKDIWVKVIRIDGSKVRIGIVAPQHVEIMREELLTELRDVDTPLESG